MKKLGIILSLSTLACSTAIGTVTYITTSNVIDDVQQSKQTSTDTVTRDKTPIDYFGQTPVLTQKTGPIISYGSKVSALDWYGSTLWSFNFNDEKNKQYFPGGDLSKKAHYTNRGFINWALDSKRNILWLLSNSVEQGKALPQNIIALNSLDGSVIECQKLIFNPESKFQYFYQIQVLSDGNVQIYSQGNGSWGKNVLYNRVTKQQTFLNVQTKDKNDKIKRLMNAHNQNKSKGEIRLFYLIPIKQNVNIAIFCDFNSQHRPNMGTGDLFLQLVDDNLNEISLSTNSEWNKMIHIPVNIKDPTGVQTQNFSKTIYTTLDGKVYFTAWNKFFVFYPNDDGYGGIKYAIKDLPDNKRILSYTMDVNENVYIKYWDDTHIYKLTIGGDVNNTTFAFNTYYDIGSSKIDLVKNNANRFVLYNVTGYSGSIMLLSSRIVSDGNYINDNTDKEHEPNYDQYGVAAAIVPNIKESTSGDSKGLLNTSESFLKTSDFTISDDILNSKIPSEITKSDISISNGFFTSNKALDNGELKYPPFAISSIDDSQGNFTITANIDQIPWFTTTLPNDAIPKKIIKSFNTKTHIQNKTSWKDDNTLSYDFKNTLPSELTEEDINNFDPFQVSFSSQTIMENGNVVYPKKIYERSSQQDSNGQVTISVTYQYVPLGVTYKNSSNVISYKTTHNYTIFSTKKHKQFFFAGSNNEATSVSKNAIDIKSVPQLKALSQANLLPSSFNGRNKNDFLQFVNTNKSAGYPISKMSFEVSPNDNDGTLLITARKNNSNETFQQLFSGFNRKTNYSFSFNSSSTIDSKPFSSMLPSSVNEGDIIDNLVQYQGFNSSDFKVTLFPNDSDGSLKVQIDLNKDYAESLGNQVGFSKYRATKDYSGFMTTEQYNNKYNVSFKENGDKSLFEIKRNTLDTIQKQIDKGGPITIGKQEYQNLNDLVRQVFVKDLGTNIPQDWKLQPELIKTNMAIDNQAGTMNLSISIDKSLLNGYDSNLNYVISYSGFSRGNIEVTDDSLTFVEGNLLNAVLPQEVMKMSPTKMAEWLKGESNGIANINKIIFNATGQYKEFLSSKKYNLTIEASDPYKTLTVNLEFTGQLSNSHSLKTYSIQYKF